MSDIKEGNPSPPHHSRSYSMILGHKNVTTTEIHAKTVDEQKKAVVDRIRLK